MKRLLLALLLAVSAWAQTSPVTSAFPSAVVTDDQLTYQDDFGSTTLSSSVGASDLTIFITSAVGFVEPAVIALCPVGECSSGNYANAELMLVTGISGTTLTIASTGRSLGNDCIGSATGKTFALGAVVELVPSACAHNRLAAEIKAIETALGANLANVVEAADFDTEAELETLLTDVTNLIVSTEIDTVAELEALAGAVNLIASTEVDSIAELEALLGAVNVLLATEMDTSAEVAAVLGDETGTGAVVFNIAPNLQGVIDGTGTPVDDDDCTGQQGEWWYDSTDGQFEFCNADSGTPSVPGSGGGGGAPTDATYLTNSANGSLTDEVVVNNEATLESAIGAVNLIVSTEVDTQAEAEALFNADFEADDLSDDTAADLPFAPAGTIAAVTVQAAIEEVADSGSGGSADFLGDITSPTELTLATGAVTISAAGTYTLDTEGDAATDDFSAPACTAGSSGFLRAANDARTVVLISSAISTPYGVDLSLDQDGDIAEFVCPATDTLVILSFFDEASQELYSPIDGGQGLTGTTTAEAGSVRVQMRRHADNCQTQTDGLDGEACYQQNTSSLWHCVTGDGLCDTRTEWVVDQFGSGLIDWSFTAVPTTVALASGSGTFTSTAHIIEAQSSTSDDWTGATCSAGVIFSARMTGHDITIIDASFPNPTGVDITLDETGDRVLVECEVANTPIVTMYWDATTRTLYETEASGSADGVGYELVDDEDTPLTQRGTLNFEGAGVTCADDTDQTTCTIPGGGGSCAYYAASSAHRSNGLSVIGATATNQDDLALTLFDAVAESMTAAFLLPPCYTGQTMDLIVPARIANTSADLVLTAKTACFALGEGPIATPTYNTGQTITVNGGAVDAGDYIPYTITGLTMTGCAAGEFLMIDLEATTATAGGVQVLGMMWRNQ